MLISLVRFGCLAPRAAKRSSLGAGIEAAARSEMESWCLTSGEGAFPGRIHRVVEGSWASLRDSSTPLRRGRVGGGEPWAHVQSYPTCGAGAAIWRVRQQLPITRAGRREWGMGEDGRRMVLQGPRRQRAFEVVPGEHSVRTPGGVNDFFPWRRRLRQRSPAPGASRCGRAGLGSHSSHSSPDAARFPWA